MTTLHWVPARHAAPSEAGRYQLIACVSCPNREDGRQHVVFGACIWNTRRWIVSEETLPPSSRIVAWLPRVPLTHPGVEVSILGNGQIAVTFPVPALTLEDLMRLAND